MESHHLPRTVCWKSYRPHKYTPYTPSQDVELWCRHFLSKKYAKICRIWIGIYAPRNPSDLRLPGPAKKQNPSALPVPHLRSVQKCNVCEIIWKSFFCFFPLNVCVYATTKSTEAFAALSMTGAVYFSVGPCEHDHLWRIDSQYVHQAARHQLPHVPAYQNRSGMN